MAPTDKPGKKSQLLMTSSTSEWHKLEKRYCSHLFRITGGPATIPGAEKKTGAGRQRVT